MDYKVRLVHRMKDYKLRLVHRMKDANAVSTIDAVLFWGKECGVGVETIGAIYLVPHGETSETFYL